MSQRCSHWPLSGLAFRLAIASPVLLLNRLPCQPAGSTLSSWRPLRAVRNATLTAVAPVSSRLSSFRAAFLSRALASLRRTAGRVAGHSRCAARRAEPGLPAGATMGPTRGTTGPAPSSLELLTPPSRFGMTALGPG